MQLLKIKDFVSDKIGQGNGGQVAHGDFIGGRVFDDFGTQVAALDRSKVLLVRFFIASILVQHVGRSRLDLRLHDGVPEFLGFDHLAGDSLRFVLCVQFLHIED